MRSEKLFPYRGTLAVMAATAAVAAPAAAVAAPVSVNLRVEGVTHTIYDEQITTDAHAVTTQKGGTHLCDGTNGGANPSPGPTGTAALDDGARLGGFGWDGPFYDGFSDFAVERVGSDVATSTQFWGLLLNYDFTSVGGCQQRIAEGDQVLWAYDAFSARSQWRDRAGFSPDFPSHRPCFDAPSIQPARASSSPGAQPRRASTPASPASSAAALTASAAATTKKAVWSCM